MAPRDRNFTSAGDVLFFEVVHKVGDFEYLQVLQGGPSDSVYKPLTFAFLVFDFQERRLKTNRSSSTSPCQLLALQEFNQVWPRSFHEKGILYCKHKSNLFCGSFAVTPGQPPPQPQYRDVPVS